MSNPDIHVGNVGTVYRLRLVDQDGAVVDLTGYTTLEIIFVKASGVRMVKTATTGDPVTGVVEYTSILGDIDEIGSYRCQAHVVIPGGEFFSAVFTFYVKGNL